MAEDKGLDPIILQYDNFKLGSEHFQKAAAVIQQNKMSNVTYLAKPVHHLSENELEKMAEQS